MVNFKNIMWTVLGLNRSRPVNKVSDSTIQKAEIERKFLIKSKPIIPSDIEIKHITQAYLFVSNEMEERIRREESEENGTKYFYTKKFGSGLERKENEYPIEEWEYKKFLLSTRGNIIEKTRFVIPHNNGVKLEYDVYHGALDGLEVVEVEFPSVETSNQFSPPDWFGPDVTERKDLKNKSLATKGIPEDIKQKIDAKEKRLASQPPVNARINFQ